MFFPAFTTACFPAPQKPASQPASQQIFTHLESFFSPPAPPSFFVLCLRLLLLICRIETVPQPLYPFPSLHYKSIGNLISCASAANGDCLLARCPVPPFSTSTFHPALCSPLARTTHNTHTHTRTQSKQIQYSPRPLTHHTHLSIHPSTHTHTHSRLGEEGGPKERERQERKIKLCGYLFLQAPTLQLRSTLRSWHRHFDLAASGSASIESHTPRGKVNRACLQDSTSKRQKPNRALARQSVHTDSLFSLFCSL